MVTGSEETLPESLPACSLTLFLLPCPSLLPPPSLPSSRPLSSPFYSYPSLLLAFSVSSLPQLGVQGMINMSVNSSWSLAFVQGGVSDSDSLSMRKAHEPFPCFLHLYNLETSCLCPLPHTRLAGSEIIGVTHLSP